MLKKPKKKKFVSVAEFAIRLCVDDSTVRRWIRKGEIKATRIGNAGNWIIPRSELDRILKTVDEAISKEYDERSSEKIEW
ncbi:helix-turn-helix domain-containing protein [Verrucomicrobia bacterium S94]|nr:helix-turn-helix domain-containing protein [Verrucomicrobia bacterium S94]